jgi:IMP cyclohydrolase
MKTLITMTYPGRFIIIGRDPSGRHDLVAYGITGRSPSSQARRLELEGDAIFTRPTDPKALEGGNADLLVYPAVTMGPGLVVSNGRQTTAIDPLSDESPIRVLEKGLEGWTYEPDAPIFTPRIAGCVLPGRRAGLGLLKRAADGSAERSFFEFPLVPGLGKLVSTYAGENANPLPVFGGEPLGVHLAETTAEATARSIYEALRPGKGKADFRIAVACVFLPSPGSLNHEVAIVNRQERTAR